MNLIKCFKKNYAIQNIKKSKGILTILLLVIPIITLFSVYVQDQSNYSEPYHIFIAGGANLLGMAIIPFLLSNVLFGYIFKKNNIDFIHSMPISRKSIFLTNTIIGFLYILVLQVLNFVVTSIYIMIVGNSLISIKMMFDIGLAMCLVYMFLFTVSTLSISVSGNIYTQIVVALLLIFLLPFIRMTNFKTDIEGFNKVYLVNNNGETICYDVNNEALFAMPITTFLDFIDESRVLETKSAILTLGLTALYILVGMNVFERRKMENTGSSFEDEKVHLFVKGLTLYPAIFILKEVIEELELPYILLIVFLLFVYYFIFDLITSKKIKLKKTLVSYVVTFICLMIITTSLSALGENLNDKKDYYYADEIIELELRFSELYYGDNWFGKIEDESLIKAILDEALVDNNYYGYYDYAINSYDTVKKSKAIELRCKFNGGKEVEVYGYLSNDLYKRVLDYAINNETYINDLVNKFKVSKNSMVSFVDSGLDLTFIGKKHNDLIENINNNLKDTITNKLKSDLKNFDNQNYVSKNYNVLGSMRMYEYDNFERKTYSLTFDHNTKLAEEIYKEINKKALELTEERIKKLEKTELDNYIFNSNGRITFCEENGNIEKAMYIDSINIRELKKYFEQFDPEAIDVTKAFVQITVFDIDTAIFINDLEDFKSKVSYTATLEDDEEYYFTNESVLKEMETEDSYEDITPLETNSL